MSPKSVAFPSDAIVIKSIVFVAGVSPLHITARVLFVTAAIALLPTVNSPNLVASPPLANVTVSIIFSPAG